MSFPRSPLECRGILRNVCHENRREMYAAPVPGPPGSSSRNFLCHFPSTPEGGSPRGVRSSRSSWVNVGVMPLPARPAKILTPLPSDAAFERNRPPFLAEQKNGTARGTHRGGPRPSYPFAGCLIDSGDDHASRLLLLAPCFHLSRSLYPPFTLLASFSGDLRSRVDASVNLSRGVQPQIGDFSFCEMVSRSFVCCRKEQGLQRGAL